MSRATAADFDLFNLPPAGAAPAAPASLTPPAAAAPSAPDDPLYLPHAERADCPADVAEMARTLGYDPLAALGMVEFVKAAESLGWARLVTRPRDFPAPGPNPYHKDGVSPAEWLCPDKAGALANLILRGVASQRPRLTVERWRAATDRLPLFAQVAEGADCAEGGSPWTAPETGTLIPRPRLALAAAFPGDAPGASDVPEFAEETR